jgi:hypothetical protein
VGYRFAFRPGVRGRHPLIGQGHRRYGVGWLSLGPRLGLGLLGRRRPSPIAPSQPNPSLNRCPSNKTAFSKSTIVQGLQSVFTEPNLRLCNPSHATIALRLPVSSKNNVLKLIRTSGVHNRQTGRTWDVRPEAVPEVQRTVSAGRNAVINGTWDVRFGGEDMSRTRGFGLA